MKFFNDNEYKLNIKDKENPLNKFDIVFKNWAKYNNFDKKGLRCGINYYASCSLAIGFYKKNINLDILLGLLGSKKSSIVKRIKSKDYIDNLSSSFKNLNNKEYILNRAHEYIPNEKKTFTLFNCIIVDSMQIRRMPTGRCIFNYDECVKLKNIIEDETNSEEEILL